MIRRFLCVLFGAAVLCSSACSKAVQAPVDDPVRATVSAAELQALAPGALLEPADPLELVDVRIARAGASALRINYRSTSGIDGSATAVTGTVFVPQAKPPVSGWPVVVYAHPTVGLLEECAPSAQNNLMGTVPQIEALLGHGYLVAMPDYQGLGSKGPHPYLEPRTVGYNVIDAVRAARQVEPSASRRWLAYGASQGGQAAWAAADMAADYGAGLDMVGAVALSPAADMSGLPQAAMDRMLSKNQLPLMHLMVNSVHSVDASIQLEDYLSGIALDHNDALLQCSGVGLEERNRLVFDLTADTVAPRDQVAADRLADILRTWSLPLAGPPSQVPLLVAVGSEDDMMPLQAAEGAARRACERGDLVVWNLRQGENHETIDPRPAWAWMSDRFRSTVLTDVCGIPGE